MTRRDFFLRFALILLLFLCGIVYNNLIGNARRPSTVKYAPKYRGNFVLGDFASKKRWQVDAKILKDNRAMLDRIAQTCRENNLTETTTTIATRRHFLYSSANRALCCWIRKAGSTSFTKLFSELNNRWITGDNYYRELNHITPRSDSQLVDLLGSRGTFKLLVVRHPFERLVSAYRDRIEDNTRYTAQAWIYVPKIFHLTRPEIFESPGTVDLSLSRMFHDDRRLKLVPTFGEFVDWLLQQDPAKDDHHWNQYHRHCSLCSVRYDYVLKLDNQTREALDYVYRRMNVRDVAGVRLGRLESTRSGPTDFERTCAYFKNLTHRAVVSLYDRYRVDFDMFDYDFDRYFECTEGD
ncbi:carbohydrate sulfotransferase 10-like [Trichogramma pretiosum]|uniref:carbohydrate sulfotransferase 10-like n=1 Tax=Trichogramma pretiosum TaxID=7493 RepID=UPI0006C9CC67|nr:carbohydrate sulfotransferase 10-like [Trichogramma pretiosum]